MKTFALSLSIVLGLIGAAWVHAFCTPVVSSVTDQGMFVCQYGKIYGVSAGTWIECPHDRRNQAELDAKCSPTTQP